MQISSQRLGVWYVRLGCFSKGLVEFRAIWPYKFPQCHRWLHQKVFQNFEKFEVALFAIVGFLREETQAALKDQKLVTFESKKPVALTPYLSEQVWQVGVVFWCCHMVSFRTLTSTACSQHLFWWKFLQSGWSTHSFRNKVCTIGGTLSWFRILRSIQGVSLYYLASPGYLLGFVFPARVLLIPPSLSLPPTFIGACKVPGVVLRNGLNNLCLDVSC